MSVSPGSSVYVSYPWKTADAPAMVDILQAVCEKNGIELRRDRDRISYGDSISKYMQELGAGGAIMVLVSEDYLKSPYCMYELMEIEKNQRFRERVHSIILPNKSGFDFYDVMDQLDIVAYWEQRGQALEAKISSLAQKDHLSNAYKELDLCRDIRRVFDYLTGELRDMYSPSPDVHLETAFEALLERIRRTLPSPTPPEPHHSTPRPSSDAFQRELAKTIDKELQTNAATPLRDALSTRLKTPAATLGAMLCALGEEDAVAKLTGAIVACLKQAPRGQASRELRAIARRLLGWLLMRFVREEWASGMQETSVEQAVTVGVEVGSEAGAEVLWAHWTRDDQPPDFRVIGPRVFGVRNLWSDASLPEEGWEDWSRYLDDVKKTLWTVMFGERPPAAFGPDENARLRDAFRFDRDVHSGSRFYLTVRADDVAEPLAQSDVLNAVQQDLGLPVLHVADSPEERFFSISETRLEDRIKQCLKILKGHGDD
jgi:hypothetical protein